MDLAGVFDNKFRGKLVYSTNHRDFSLRQQKESPWREGNLGWLKLHSKLTRFSYFCSTISSLVFNFTGGENKSIYLGKVKYLGRNI